MSNCYTRWSFAIPLTTPEQVAWAEGAVRFFDHATDLDWEPDDLFLRMSVDTPEDEESDEEALVRLEALAAIPYDNFDAWVAESGGTETRQVDGDEVVLDIAQLDALRVKQANEPFRALVEEVQDCSPSFEVEVDSDGLWIHADEAGTPEHVVPLIQAYLQKFDPEGGIGFEWADYSDRPILDSFGGGAVWITATDAEWNSGSRWLADRSTHTTRTSTGRPSPARTATTTRTATATTRTATR